MGTGHRRCIALAPGVSSDRGGLLIPRPRRSATSFDLGNPALQLHPICDGDAELLLDYRSLSGSRGSRL